MSPDYSDFENRLYKRLEAAERRPIRTLIKILVLIMVIGMGLRVLSQMLGFFSETAAVVREEFGPRELLRKYEWFKEAHAQLAKKRADIDVFAARVKAASGEDRFSQQNRYQAQTELVGVISSYNTLAAEYNAQMAKFNYRFTNAGMLPEGATETLPREHVPYQSEGDF